MSLGNGLSEINFVLSCLVKMTKIVIPILEFAGMEVLLDGLERTVWRKLKQVFSISETIL